VTADTRHEPYSATANLRVGLLGQQWEPGTETAPSGHGAIGHIAARSVPNHSEVHRAYLRSGAITHRVRRMDLRDSQLSRKPRQPELAAMYGLEGGLHIDDARDPWRRGQPHTTAPFATCAHPTLSNVTYSHFSSRTAGSSRSSVNLLQPMSDQHRRG
jgi:hypothetical protein